MYQIWYNGFQQAGDGVWEDCNGSEPVGGAEENKKALTSKTFKLTVAKKADETCLHVLIKDEAGNTVLNFITGDMNAEVMQGVTYLGLRTWSSEANASNFGLSDVAAEIDPPTPPSPDESDWRLQNATETGEGQLTMGKENEEAFAYYIAKEAGDTWTLAADVNVSGYNGDMAVFSVGLASGDKDSLGLAALLNFGIWNSDKLNMYQIWYNGFQQAGDGVWEDCNGSEPVGGAEENKKALTSRTFKLTVVKEAGKNSLHVLVKDEAGSTVLNFITGELNAEVMKKISHVGLRTWSGNAKISNFNLADTSEEIPLPPREKWKLQNAEETGYGLSMGKENEEATAYYVGRRAGNAWVLAADVDVDIFNGAPATFSVMLASGEKDSLNLMSLLNFNTWNSPEHNMYQIWYNGFQQYSNGQWSDRNGSEPVGGAEKDKKALTSRVFKLIVEKKKDENFLHVRIKDAVGNTVMDFATGELDAGLMNSISYVGLRTYSGKARISNFSFGTEYPATGDSADIAMMCIAMLLSAAALAVILRSKLLLRKK